MDNKNQNLPEKRKRGRPATGRGGKYNFPNAGLQRLEDDDSKRAIIGKCLNNILLVSRAFEEPPHSDEELCERLNWFFDTCNKTNQLPTIEKMCLSLSMTRETVFDILSGRNPGFSSATADVIKKAKNLIASLDAELALDSKIQPVVYMFRAKNFYGMKDSQEMEITTNSYNDYQDPATIEAKYAELPDDPE